MVRGGSESSHLSCFLLFAAPSEVLAIRQENTSQNSVILMWHEPNQPNGVILEYDIKYYEKVRQCRSKANTSSTRWSSSARYTPVNTKQLGEKSNSDTAASSLPGEHKLSLFKGL